MSESKRVLIVNDSATMRAALRVALAVAPELTVVGELHDASTILGEVERRAPDVILMDVVMPGVDGYEATRQIMATRPTPILLITSVVNPKDVTVALDALRSGALTILSAPPSPGSAGYGAAQAELVKTVRTVATLRLHARRPSPVAPVTSGAPGDRRGIDVVGIVASTGGPAALVELLSALPPRPYPPMLVVQHIAPGFTDGLAAWLGSATGRQVRVARDGEVAERGTVYVAPEDRHLGFDASGRLVVSHAAPVGLFRPSGTFLLRALAEHVGPRAVGIVLTGMGQDGAEGALALKRAGGRVLGQDERSSVVFGMARAAHKLGAIDELVPLRALAEWIAKEVEV